MGLDALIAGWELFATPLALAMTIFGCFLGLIIGVMPGLGPLMGIILLLPAVFHLPPVAAMGALIAIFVGGSCGGAVSAIVLRIPGTPIAAATLLDGYPMAQKGRAGEAIGLAITASAVGGIIAGVLLVALAPVLADFALRFGPPEYFALTLLGLIAIAVVGREAPLKGFITGVLGLLIATVGTDAISNAQRFTFGYFELSNGFHVVSIVVGLFAVSEVLLQVRAGRLLDAPNVPRVRISLHSVALLFRHPVNLVRSSAIGTFFGSLPGAGGVISAFSSYAVAKAQARPEEAYGEGAEGGVIATEAANNAAAGGTLIPTMALGVPGDASSAVLMSALILFGYFPGPELFEQNLDVAGGMFLAYIVANVALVVLGFVMTPVFLSVLRLRKVHLLPLVVMLSVMGTFALQSSIFDLWCVLGFGALGYVLRLHGYPLAPVVIGVVLGPICEANFRRSLLISRDGLSIFWEREIAFTILVVTAALVLWGLVGSGVSAWLRRQFRPS
jgi:putative tricarboxylic transport membrane protein